MRTIYLDCGMGAAGDMLTAALLELLPDKDAFVKKLNEIGIPEVKVTAEPAVKCGITGTHVSVIVKDMEEMEGGLVEHHHEHEHDHDHHHDHEHDHEHHHDHDHDHGHAHHHHSSMHEIEHIISHLQVSERVKQDVLSVYRLIAEAESNAHGVDVSQIHFHEVGTMDAIADVTAVCMLFEELHADKIIASPVHVGSGQVRCAHGTLPVPAPATAYILRDVPIYGGQIRGELCTPTGAALLKHFASEFGQMPVMKVGKIGYGMGKKDFEAANCVRAMLGEEEQKPEVVYELSCNMDDMTAEALGFAMDQLMQLGARDVFTVPVGMKKNRPGVLLSVICSEEKKEELIRGIFRHTTTLGVRETVHPRYVLNREIREVETPYGTVHQKISSGYGVTRTKLEYDDLAKIAKEQGISLEEVRKLAEKA